MSFDGDFTPNDSLWWQQKALDARQPTWSAPDRIAFAEPQQPTYHNNAQWGQYSYPGQQELPSSPHPGYHTMPAPPRGVGGNPGYPTGSFQGREGHLCVFVVLYYVIYTFSVRECDRFLTFHYVNGRSGDV